MNAKNKQDPRPNLLPDLGAAVDEHGRPPGATSRTGSGASPPADPDRVERAEKQTTHRSAVEQLPSDAGEGPRAR